MHLEQLGWDVRFLKRSAAIRAPSFGMPEKAKRVAYPMRLLRYWFMHHFLCSEAEAQGRPLQVCEVGVDIGQMLLFMRAAQEGRNQKPLWSQWVAADVTLHRDILRQNGYSEMVEVNLEAPAFALPKQYDAVIVLHILEHLFDPEAALARLAPYVKAGGMVIGGFPVAPQRFVAARQHTIRQTASRFGHVSVFSPQRVRTMAQAAGLEVEFLSGAFLMRKQGFFLENFSWWWRFNLLFGALLPSWPGEVYWVLRKPAAEVEA